MAGTKSDREENHRHRKPAQETVPFARERNLTSLVRKLEKKENEVKKLRGKMTSKFVKNVKKNAKTARKKVAKRLSGIF